MDKTELQQITKFLSQVSFFSEVSDISLKHLCQNLNSETFYKGDTIFEKDDAGNAMYVILNGKVKIHENMHTYGFIGKGECFGEYALIDSQPRSASVTAEEETSVLKIERPYFIDLMTKDSGFAQGILSVMIKRHRELDSTQEQLANSKKQLEQANGKMSGLINGAMDAIIMFDSKFRIIVTNPSADALLENDDALQRNVLFFFDEASAELIESIVKNEKEDNVDALNNYLPSVVKVIGSDEKETLNEGTISRYGEGEDTFYTLILRNIEERLAAQDTISLLTNQTEYLADEIKELTSNYGIIAQDDTMIGVLNLVEQVAKTDATVLINGETGTGKELVARAIHQASTRNDKPLIRINCGAIPANLIESELFGHEKGAFTGATASRKGRFLLADKGTIFLDEIGEMPLDLQPKLLRIIQEGEFDPVGSSETVKVDVRIIAATHRDLLTYSKEGKFREDLYYRLNVFPIVVPPLRERGDDIHLIAQEIINQFSAKLNKKMNPLGEGDKALLSRYQWPGNVRELQNIIERAVIIAQNGNISWDTLIPKSSVDGPIHADSKAEKIYSSEEMTKLERENILRALKKTRWKISGKNGAAAILKLKPTTLTSKMKALNIVRPI
ncbi:sigma 54-interacting transcriptional regulator [Pseudozobellia thermophila]|uniref:Transcriptional regulator containing GAF, AAA-type ATPase, and DNA-binding Fis domains n=1 Tax=Pseudozobellia thermophila TaxID=192903 RepID=A0A1M6DCI5_9FLAO|nr:sigma 54-interacting transcriptional regulator [Pseudozobellia thermophila]SHI70893.1 Transcriptional regulator containing GAF, AAA-type ATPase, and DNA-binding Fis domains [Pseudozobellia thermophila]